MYTNEEIISKANGFITTIFKDECTGHDVLHTKRVYETSMDICEKEGGNSFIVQLVALLHDVDDYKLDVPRSADDPFFNAHRFMDSVGLDKVFQQEMIEMIDSISFKGSDSTRPSTKEGQIVQDADRLDALGAIGIARTFAYGGHASSPIYDPTISPKLDMDGKTYKSHRGTSINHFYEKLLKLKNLMNTKEGLMIAEKRTKFMEDYLEEFYDECGTEYSLLL